MLELFHSLLRVAAVLAGALVVLWLLLAQPSWRRNNRVVGSLDPNRLREHVELLSQILYPRNWRQVQRLERAADYIETQFRAAGAEVERQPIQVGGATYYNVIARFNSEAGPRVVVGAHYDAWEDTPGADDNASGVAALIELAYLIGAGGVTSFVELVAYVLEEPPFFRTDQMGSVAHAAMIARDSTPTRGVIVLEMVGYFSDEPGSQQYPIPLLRFYYPGRGNFIAVASRWDQGAWVRRVKAGMKGATDLPVYSIRAPSWLPGIDMSDHRSYWPHGIPALMVTDTAFYRNTTYHTRKDTADRLDYARMAHVVMAVYAALDRL